LEERTKSVARRILKDLGLPLQGRELSKLGFPEARGNNNLIGAFRIMHAEVNRYLNIESKERSKISLSQAENALSALDDLGDNVRDRIQQVRDKSI
jgi:hypothetical protein